MTSNATSPISRSFLVRCGLRSELINSTALVVCGAAATLGLDMAAHAATYTEFSILAHGTHPTGINNVASTENVLFSFNGTDGEAPYAGLLNVKGTLYGTTNRGGSNGDGTMFSFIPGTGAETLLYSFGSGTDGANPYAGLIDVRGTLFGATYGGGSDGNGTVFSFNLNAGGQTLLYSFGSGTDGENPYADLVNFNGTLYGTTEYGGAYGKGTIFSVDPQTGAETVLHSFGSGTDGWAPYAGLINVKGTLYGTTGVGGGSGCDGGGCGTVFSFNPKTGHEKVLHSFGKGTDGSYVLAGLIDVGGTLYGTTASGGIYGEGYGTVFSFDPKTRAEEVLHSFGNGSDGQSPFAGVIDVGGKLYGTTWNGGVYGYGTVYSLDLKADTEKVLHSFGNGTDGKSPTADLIDVKGTLYSTTAAGGTYGDGTLFSIVP